MRIFIAIDIPKEIQEKIKHIQKQLPEFTGKNTELNNLHLTLKFLGEVDENQLEKMEKQLEKVKAKKFHAIIDSIGVFSPDFIKIIWLHFEGADTLQKAVDFSLKNVFPSEERFMSHLTIARVKIIKDKKKFLEELKKIKIEKMEFLVNSFKIKESVLTPQGPVYKTLREYNLENIN